VSPGNPRSYLIPPRSGAGVAVSPGDQWKRSRRS